MLVAERQRQVGASVQRHAGEFAQWRHRHAPSGHLPLGDPVRRQCDGPGQRRAENIGIDFLEARPAGLGQRHLRRDRRAPVGAVEAEHRRSRSALRHRRIECRARNVDAACRTVVEFGLHRQACRAAPPVKHRRGGQRAANILARKIGDLGNRQRRRAVDLASRRHGKPAVEFEPARLRLEIGDRQGAGVVETDACRSGRAPGEEPVEARIARLDRSRPQRDLAAALAVLEPQRGQRHLGLAAHRLFDHAAERRKVGNRRLDIAGDLHRAAAHVEARRAAELRFAAQSRERRFLDQRGIAGLVDAPAQPPAGGVQGLVVREIQKRLKPRRRSFRLHRIVGAFPRRRRRAVDAQRACFQRRILDPVGVASGLPQPGADARLRGLAEERQLARHRRSPRIEAKLEIDPLAEGTMHVATGLQGLPGVDFQRTGHQPGAALPFRLGRHRIGPVEPCQPRHDARPPGRAVRERELERPALRPGMELEHRLDPPRHLAPPRRLDRNVRPAARVERMARRIECDFLARQRLAQQHVAQREGFDVQRQRQRRQFRQRKNIGVLVRLPFPGGRPRQSQPVDVEPRHMQLPAPQRQRPPVEFGRGERRPGSLRVGDGEIAEPQPSRPHAVDAADIDLGLAGSRRRECHVQQCLAHRRDVDKADNGGNTREYEPRRQQQGGEDAANKHDADMSVRARHQNACPSDT